MIKTTIVGLWVCAVTIAAGYFGTTWQAEKHNDDETSLAKMTQVKVRPLSVPVVKEGKVSGYIVAQFSYIAKAETVKQLTVSPEAFLLDAAYKGLYTGKEFDLAKLDKNSWSGLAKTVKEQVNARYGSEVLHDVLLEDFGFVAAGSVRHDSELAGAKKPAKDGHGH